MENTVSAFISKENLIAKGMSVCVAVSGGADSMSLLHCLLNIKDKHGFNLFALHFNHGIRGDASNADAMLVKRECARLGVKLYAKSADVPSLAKLWRAGIETAAKRAREAFFDDILNDKKADVIATAHHADDNLESVLMHVFRGCGISGLIGIRAKKGKIIRPLLCVQKKDITDYAQKNGVAYSTDETNLICDNTRNYLRNIVIPQVTANINPEVPASAVRLSQSAKCDEDFIMQAALSAYGSLARTVSEGIALGIAGINALHPAVAVRVVKIALGNTCGLTDIESAHIEAVLSLITRGETGKRVNLVRGAVAEVRYGDLLILARPENNRLQIPADGFEITNIRGIQKFADGTVLKGEPASGGIKHSRGGFFECFDAKALEKPLILRTRRDGDRIRPLGAPGTKKLKDYFIDKKIPRSARDITPLLTSGREILWVVGHTISHDCRVTENTKEVLTLRYIRKE